ncbi:Arylsulfatase G [Holothuria leucospilota]|uniref:Arylsulfatase G n=1 Tax=Holothuria leucospilota TaxID=206669 RepID=A0A9Q1C4M2_HOLLE|nr:Arylsulfatase G [Holothuria leucospilota]
MLMICVQHHTNIAVSSHPPNMVIILLDDVGYGDLGSYWNPIGQLSNTPFLDYMADNGIRFTDFHSAASICTPSRGSLLTGRLCARTGYPNRVPDGFVGGLPLNETTFGEIFKSAGYRTGMIGKWGMGIEPKYHPNSRGFDFYFGLPDGNNNGCIDEAGGTLLPNVCPRDESDAPGHDGSFCYLCESETVEQLALPLFHNRLIVEQPVNLTSLSLRYAEMGADFVKESTRPYLLYVGLAHMHVPLFHMPEFEGKSASNSVYGDTLLEMDNTVKTIVEAIKDSGEEDNTLVWVLSDNGPEEGQCQFAGSPGPFSGVWQKNEGGGGTASKGTAFEAGHRVPSIVYWPGTIKGGQVVDTLTNSMDIYPTIAALANIQIPTNRIYDGMDISDILLGRPFSRKRVLYHPIANIFDYRCDIQAVRIGDYKAIFVTGGRADCERNTGNLQIHSPPLIFNVQEDPMESIPLDPDSNLFGSVLEKVDQAMADIEQSLQMDSTPIVEPKYNPCLSIPCCNPLNVVCRC